MKPYGIVIFETTSLAMQAESVTEKAGIQVKLVPTPRELSSNCGIALRFNWEDSEKVREVLDEANVETAGIHKMRSR